MKNSILIMFACCFCSITAGAQDPHFSQYFMSPLTVNPALTAKGVSDWRLSSVFRSQWWGTYGQPYTTSAVSLEKAVATGANDKSTLGLGVSLLNDASNGGLLKNNYASLHVAYTLSLNATGSEQLGIGITGTYANRLLNLAMFEYESQFGSMGYQRSIPSSDIPVIEKRAFFDVNTGVMYSRRVNSRMGYHVGAAIFHAAKPVQGAFKNSTYSLDPRYTIQAGMQLYAKDGNELHAGSLLDMQGPNKVFSLGAVYKIKSAKSEHFESVNVGIWHRFGDSFYPYIAMEGKKWIVGATYDILSSSNREQYNYVQSLEMSFAWLFGKKQSNTSSIIKY